MGDWRPIETAPRDGTPVLLRCKDRQMQVGEFANRSDGTSFWEIGHTESGPLGLLQEATHWMPLPNPPEDT